MSAASKQTSGAVPANYVDRLVRRIRSRFWTADYRDGVAELRELVARKPGSRKWSALQILQWAERHDLEHLSPLEVRCAFEDAATTEPDSPNDPDQR